MYIYIYITIHIRVCYVHRISLGRQRAGWVMRASRISSGACPSAPQARAHADVHARADPHRTQVWYYLKCSVFMSSKPRSCVPSALSSDMVWMCPCIHAPPHAGKCRDARV